MLDNLCTTIHLFLFVFSGAKVNIPQSLSCVNIIIINLGIINDIVAYKFRPW